MADGISTKLKTTSVDFTRACRLQNAGVRRAGTSDAAQTSLTVAPGAEVEFCFTLDYNDPANAIANGVCVVPLSADGEPRVDDRWVWYSTRQGVFLGAIEGGVVQGRVRHTVGDAGTYRLHAGGVATAEGWCAPELAATLTLAVEAAALTPHLALKSTPPFQPGAELEVRWSVDGYAAAPGLAVVLQSQAPDGTRAEQDVTADGPDDGSGAVSIFKPAGGPGSYQLALAVRGASGTVTSDPLAVQVGETPAPISLRLQLDKLQVDVGSPFKVSWGIDGYRPDLGLQIDLGVSGGLPDGTGAREVTSQTSSDGTGSVDIQPDRGGHFVFRLAAFPKGGGSAVHALSNEVGVEVRAPLVIDQLEANLKVSDGLMHPAHSLQIVEGNAIVLSWSAQGATRGFELSIDPPAADPSLPRTLAAGDKQLELTPTAASQDYALVALGESGRSDPRSVHVSLHPRGHLYGPHANVTPPGEPARILRFVAYKSASTESSGGSLLVVPEGTRFRLRAELDGEIDEISIDPGVGPLGVDEDSGIGEAELTFAQPIGSSEIRYTLTVKPTNPAEPVQTQSVRVGLPGIREFEAVPADTLVGPAGNLLLGPGKTAPGDISILAGGDFQPPEDPARLEAVGAPLSAAAWDLPISEYYAVKVGGRFGLYWRLRLSGGKSWKSMGKPYLCTSTGSWADVTDKTDSTGYGQMDVPAANAPGSVAIYLVFPSKESPPVAKMFVEMLPLGRDEQPEPPDAGPIRVDGDLDIAFFEVWTDNELRPAYYDTSSVGCYGSEGNVLQGDAIPLRFRVRGAFRKKPIYIHRIDKPKEKTADLNAITADSGACTVATLVAPSDVTGAVTYELVLGKFGELDGFGNPYPRVKQITVNVIKRDQAAVPEPGFEIVPGAVPRTGVAMPPPRGKKIEKKLKLASKEAEFEVPPKEKWAKITLAFEAEIEAQFVPENSEEEPTPDSVLEEKIRLLLVDITDTSKYNWANVTTVRSVPQVKFGDGKLRFSMGVAFLVEHPCGLKLVLSGLVYLDSPTIDADGIKGGTPGADLKAGVTGTIKRKLDAPAGELEAGLNCEFKISVVILPELNETLVEYGLKKFGQEMIVSALEETLGGVTAFEGALIAAPLAAVAILVWLHFEEKSVQAAVDKARLIEKVYETGYRAGLATQPDPSYADKQGDKTPEFNAGYSAGKEAVWNAYDSMTKKDDYKKWYEAAVNIGKQNGWPDAEARATQAGRDFVQRKLLSAAGEGARNAAVAKQMALARPTIQNTVFREYCDHFHLSKEVKDVFSAFWPPARAQYIAVRVDSYGRAQVGDPRSITLDRYSGEYDETSWSMLRDKCPSWVNPLGNMNKVPVLPGRVASDDDWKPKLDEEGHPSVPADDILQEVYCRALVGDSEEEKRDPEVPSGQGFFLLVHYLGQAADVALAPEPMAGYARQFWNQSKRLLTIPLSCPGSARPGDKLTWTVKVTPAPCCGTLHTASLTITVVAPPAGS